MSSVNIYLVIVFKPTNIYFNFFIPNKSNNLNVQTLKLHETNRNDRKNLIRT